MKEIKDLNVKNAPMESTTISADDHSNKVRFEIFGEEVIEKIVKQSGNSGRVYLPPMWIGHRVKIVRTV